MSRNKKQKDPFRTLVRGVILLVVAAAVFAGVMIGLNIINQSALEEKIKDTESLNQQRQQEYQSKLAEYQSATQKGENLSWPGPAKTEGWDVVDVSAFDLENTRSIPTDRASLLAGGMMLVNQWHALPSDFSDAATVSVITASGKKVGAADANVKLFQPAIDALTDIITAAAAEGQKDYFVSEGLRTMARQTELYEAKRDALSTRYSGDTLEEQTKKSVNYPGTSEFQSGFSFTMGIYPNPNKLGFQVSDQGKWFTENCWKYGLIFRFPTQDFPNSSWVDKSYKTGVTVTLNLYRWVGIPHATVMRQMDFCMEEYVEYLIAHPHLAVYENGKLKYEIFREEVGDAASVNIRVPLAAVTYLASLDNMGGVVTAYTYQ